MCRHRLDFHCRRPHPSGAPEETLEYFDYVVIGEGEETLPELVKVIQEKENPGKVFGIAFRDPRTNKVCHNSEKALCRP